MWEIAHMVARRTFTFCEVEHPAYEARGAHDGPHVALIGGVHGCEYSSIAAVNRFMGDLDTADLSGSITAVPVVSMESFRQRSPFVVPVDGKNLNRSFPGSYEGTYTDVLARSIFDQVIAPADVLLDLHGGDLVEALEPFATYDVSPHEEHSAQRAAPSPDAARRTDTATLARDREVHLVPRIPGRLVAADGRSRRRDRGGPARRDAPHPLRRRDRGALRAARRSRALPDDEPGGRHGRPTARARRRALGLTSPVPKGTGLMTLSP
jgi:hypothetical protein